MFFLIDKEEGISSFDVIRKLRKITGKKKMGHTGTLDPFATGLLLIATENSTKLIPLLEGEKKEYIARVILDGKSSSLDRETPIDSIDTSKMIKRSDREISDFLVSLTSQIPPKYSAVHVGGKRAYALAREDKDFSLPARDIEIHEAEILSQGNNSLDIRVLVSAGTYIRSLAPVLGEFFGVEGGYLASLRRTQIHIKGAHISLEHTSSLSDPIEVPYSKIFPTIPTYTIDIPTGKDIRDGKPFLFEKIREIPVGELFFLSDEQNKYLSLCRNTNNTPEIIRNNVG